MVGKVINLLYVDDQLSEIARITKQFRLAGYTVREEHATSVAEIQASAGKLDPDIVFFNINLSEPTIEPVRAALSDCRSHASILAISHEENAPERLSWLSNDAADAISSTQSDLLMLVCQRELASAKSRSRERALEKSLREADERCNGLLGSSRDAIAYVHEGAHVYVNPAYLELFGYAGGDELEGLPLMNMVVSENRTELRSFIKAFGRGDRSRDRIEVTATRSDGHTFPGEIQLQPASVQGEPCVQVVFLDISPEPDLASRLAEYHQRDMLTRLYNRQYFKELLDSAHLKAIDGETEGTLFLVELDQYREICEQSGLTAGDQVIREAAELLKQSSRPEDVLARYSESSLVVLSEVVCPHDAEAFAERLRSRMEQHVVQADSRMITATCTVGVARIDQHHADAGSLIASVEHSCTEARRLGGNRVIITGTPETGTDTVSPDEVIAEINAAIANGQISLTFQPIASLKGDGGERFEIRPAVRTDGEALLPPAHAFPDAADLGLTKLFDEWATDQAVSVLGECNSNGRKVTFFLPISASALLDSAFLESLPQRLPQGSNVVLQVSENLAQEYYRQTLDLSNKLHAHGCKLALDEFSQGQNGEKLIELLQPDFLKFASEIVTDLGSDHGKREYVDKLSQRLSSHGGQCIADRISSAQQLAAVWQTSLELIQGDFVAPASDSLEFDFDQFVA